MTPIGLFYFQPGLNGRGERPPYYVLLRIIKNYVHLTLVSLHRHFHAPLYTCLDKCIVYKCSVRRLLYYIYFELRGIFNFYDPSRYLS
jgi:hypothetical protein